MTTGPSTATNDVSVAPIGGSVSVNSEAAKAAYAPDVLTSPTAPCRIGVGGSAGWLGGAIGFGTSTLDEGCDLRETSRHLSNIGQKEAAVQVMCLHEGARKALEVSGVICRVTSDSK